METRRRRSASEPATRSSTDVSGQPADPGPGSDPGHPTVYQVRVKGHLDDRWGDWCEGLSVTREEGGETVLVVPVVDQAALHGLLRKLRDIGLPLVSINPAGPVETSHASREANR